LSAVEAVKWFEGTWGFHFIVEFVDLVLSLINIYKVFTSTIWERLRINCFYIMIVWFKVWIAIINKIASNPYFTIVLLIDKFTSNLQIGSWSVCHYYGVRSLIGSFLLESEVITNWNWAFTDVWKDWLLSHLHIRLKLLLG
jgi:hypothetical protein